jgi:hypothetical protein
MSRLYVAAPYSNERPDVVVLNVLTAIEAGDDLANAGHDVFIPHLNHYWHQKYPHEYDFWMKQDDAWLEVCDALVRVGGHSKGADAEVERAKELDIPVFYSVKEFLEAQL